jgi:transcription initiation factor TFIID subunit 7
LRYGEVRFDQWFLYAKVVDIPTIIESLKTIDNKNFYKTADICQMMICKEEPEEIPSTDDESPQKNKKKDPNKVEKKFLWPHGITPPCKNVRKRRFRKTLKKKYVEAPEIEKEVKRLLRVDNEAVNVKWELITEAITEEEANEKEKEENQSNVPKSKKAPTKYVKLGKKQDLGEAGPSGLSKRDRDQLDEHDIFGENISDDSDDEEANLNVMDLDDTHSRLSAEDSRMSMGSLDGRMMTEFQKNMFGSPSHQMDVDQRQASDSFGNEDDEGFQMSRESIKSKINEKNREIADLNVQRTQKEQEIETIDNKKLKERLQEDRDNLLSKIFDKEMEKQKFEEMLEDIDEQADFSYS